jgi:hypothetical protein
MGGCILTRKYVMAAGGLGRIPNFLNAARFAGPPLENWGFLKGAGRMSYCKFDAA